MARAPRQIGLLRRITTATVTAVVLIGLGATAIGTELTLRAQRSTLERRAQLLASSTALRMGPLSSSQRSALARALTDALGCTITVLDAHGTPLPRSPTVPTAALRAATATHDATEVKSLDDAGLTVAVESLRGRGDEVESLLVAIALPSPAARRGAVALLAVKLLLALTVMGAVALAVSLMVARDITDDLKSVLRRGARMTAGSAEALRPLPVRARDEVGALVTAFNRLQRRFNDELALHRNALARLDENERRRETLITTLRHELRTPLNAILGFAELLLQEVDGPLNDAQRDDVSVIARSGEGLVRLVDDVLDLSAMASGRYELKRESVDFAALAREVVREAQGIARTRGVALSVSGVDRADVYGDPVALRRALVNLVVNAIEHAGGQVRVSIERRERGIAVSVRDNGPGIAPSELRRLFKPFERGRTAEARGAGLGLAITLGICELHGGALSAHSVVGEGSTFTATVPAGLTPLPGSGEHPRATEVS